MRRLLRVVLVATGLVLLHPSFSIGNELHERLLKLDEGKRREVVAVLMAKSGEKCGKVTRTFFQGTNKADGAVFWNFTCSNGESYGLEIEDDAVGSNP